MESTVRGSSPSKASAAVNDSPEQLLDVFKAAALSVTKLYKTSAAAQTKARADGYQDCLDDLLSFLDRRNIGVSDGEGWQIRRWATERLDGRDATSQTNDSEDEIEKRESPKPEARPNHHDQAPSGLAPEVVVLSNSNENTSPADAASTPRIVVPSQDAFTFQSTMPYPQDSDLNMGNLALSDSKTTDATLHQSNTQSRHRPNRSGPRQRTSNHLGRGAGQKRKLNFAEIFDLGSLGGKDVFGSGGKRNRHA